MHGYGLGRSMFSCETLTLHSKKVKSGQDGHCLGMWNVPNWNELYNTSIQEMSKPFLTCTPTFLAVLSVCSSQTLIPECQIYMQISTLCLCYKCRIQLVVIVLLLVVLYIIYNRLRSYNFKHCILIYMYMYMYMHIQEKCQFPVSI